MLRSLVHEVVRRRLWPIPVVALVIALAAPLLFMKSTPDGAPAADEAPPAAAPGTLPSSAQKLLTTSDKAVVPRKRSTRKRQDPFAPPAAAVKAEQAATGTGDAAASTASVPVVIKNSDGSTSTATISPSTGTATETSKTPKASAPKITVPKVTAPKQPAVSKTVAYVDVAFGKQMGTMVRYRIPKLQTFQADRRVAALFVGYSTKRNAAVFAVAPSTEVSGVTCRKVDDVCRYIDLPAGAHARLKLRRADGSVIKRRLDVVSIRKLPPAAPSKASERKTTLSAAKCLLKGLLALPAIAPSMSIDSCD